MNKNSIVVYKNQAAVVTDRDNDKYVIIVEDNGRGIEQKNLGNIFERFYRTDASRNSAQGGSGIGLAGRLPPALA